MLFCRLGREAYGKRAGSVKSLGFSGGCPGNLPADSPWSTSCSRVTPQIPVNKRDCLPGFAGLRPQTKQSAIRCSLASYLPCQCALHFLLSRSYGHALLLIPFVTNSIFPNTQHTSQSIHSRPFVATAPIVQVVPVNMDSPASPPKRITRARAAAKAATSSTAASAAKSKATAAAKAKATTSATSSIDAAPAARKSMKRKTRPDDHEEESEVETIAKRTPPASRTATRATRGPGRPKTVVDARLESEPAPRALRGRPAKKALSEPAKEEAATRATRTRARKPQIDEDDDADDLAPEPVKKPARGRPAGTATSASAPTSKPVKKTVTFAEPDKENVVPVTGARKTAATKTAEPPASGLRAKPVRKPAGTGRTTRTTATKKSSAKDTDNKKATMPLSPKKVSQLSVNRDLDVDSEDELAMDGTPARPFHRSPVKPTMGRKRPTKMQDDGSDEEAENNALPPTESTILLGSPIRRPPQSPFKNSMKSPAKRIEGLQLSLSTTKDTLQSSASPFKASLLQSPAKRPPMPMKAVDLELSSSREQTIASPFKQSLLQSPAKRPFSPFKPVRVPEEPTEARSPAPTPVLLCTPPAVEETEEVALAEPTEVDDEAEPNDQGVMGSSKPDFNGRMSTLLPREADSALNRATWPEDEPVQDDDCETIVLEEEKEEVENSRDSSDPMVLDEAFSQNDDVALGDISTTPPNSPPQETLNMFGLRQKDLNPFDSTYSESEDELTRVMDSNIVSPVKQMRGSTMRPRTSGFGFTPLARRFDEWQPRSPHKTPKAAKPMEARQDVPKSRDSMKNTFFDDEMCVRPEGTENESANDTDPLAGIPEIKDPVCEDISITEEDLALAAEANEMSVMSPEQVESMLDLDGNDGSISEASQEYGDENEVPGQNLHNGVAIPPVTPQRSIRREFHTVSKVPLKPADESTPLAQPSLKKRRYSISRLPLVRPTHGLSRSATVISYSPSKQKDVESAFEEAAEEESLHERSGSVPPPETPTKNETWSQAETPARTPRRDVDPTLLRGAVVFVDVHTMEGADASAIFIELLNQMGARCVKTWHWNPNDEDASSKIGITHVVYKDGGKRTMEKVRETGGVVQCVGVGWVLE